MMNSTAIAVTPEFISEPGTAARRFFQQVGTSAHTRLTVVSAGWEECSADQAIVRPDFPCLSLEFVAAGEGEVWLDGRRHLLSAGTVFSHGPEISHEVCPSADRRLRKYFVDFVGIEGRRLLRECGLEPGRVVQLSTPTEFRDAFDTLIRLADAKHRDAVQLRTLQLEILIRMTIRPAPPAMSSERRARATFERCRRQIDEQFIRFHTLEKAADACHVDASYLCRLFHRFQGERPFRYLQRQQMEWAAQRLRTSGLLIREVADELGIDAFQFSRTFKRIHGVSASEFLSAQDE